MPISVGSAPDDTVVVEDGGMTGHHLRLSDDHRGWVLDIASGASRVYVNARPVRERALLRAGDVVAVGACRFRLCAPRPGDQPVHRGTCTHPALRAVAGPRSGQVMTLGDGLGLGLDGRPTAGPDPLVRFACADTGVRLQARQEVWIDGWPVRSAQLQPGVQVAFGVHRFVLDGGFIPADAVAVHHDPSPRRTGVAHRRVRHQMVWLVGTAAALALLLVGLIVAHH